MLLFIEAKGTIDTAALAGISQFLDILVEVIKAVDGIVATKPVPAQPVQLKTFTEAVKPADSLPEAEGIEFKIMLAAVGWNGEQFDGAPDWASISRTLMKLCAMQAASIKLSNHVASKKAAKQPLPVMEPEKLSPLNVMQVT